MSAQKRLNGAANRVPAAMLLVEELRAAVLDDAPQAVTLPLLEELQNVLSGIEDSVGCRTPATLFDAESEVG